ncbi:helix-turn-helix domain-containing protein [Rhizobacter sp. P5_C2]
MWFDRRASSFGCSASFARSRPAAFPRPRELGIGQRNVGRHIGSLESHLALRLLHRATRKLSLTMR